MNLSANHLSHDAVNERLPWYVNGTLSDDQRVEVDAHIESCAECREALSLCQEMAAAVRSDVAIPIPPGTSAELLLARRADRPSFASRSGWRIAAAIAVITVAGLLATPWLAGTGGTNQRFETVTEPSSLAAVDYVFAVRFEADTSAADRESVLAFLGGEVLVEDEELGVYRVTLSLPPQSLNELDARATALAGRDEIAAADVVALQVPVQ